MHEIQHQIRRRSAKCRRIRYHNHRFDWRLQREVEALSAMFDEGV